jgi:hypothetical protein
LFLLINKKQLIMIEASKKEERMIRFNPAQFSNSPYQRPIGTLVGQVKLSEEAQRKANSGGVKTALDLVEIAKENPTPKQNVSLESLKKEEGSEGALNIPAAVESVKKQDGFEEEVSLQEKSKEDQSFPKALDGEKDAVPEDLNSPVIVEERKEEKNSQEVADIPEEIKTSKSFLKNERIVNFCAFFNNILTSPPVVTFLAIAAVAGLFQCSLAGLAITSTTGTLAIMILWNCYPKVQTLAGLVGTFATVYFATQQARQTTRSFQESAESMNGVAQNVLPVANALFRGGQQQQQQPLYPMQQPFPMAPIPAGQLMNGMMQTAGPMLQQGVLGAPQQQPVQLPQPQQVEPHRQPERAPAPLPPANHQSSINPNTLIQGGQTLTEVAIQAPRFGTAGRVALGVGAVTAVGVGGYYLHQWYQNRNKNAEGEEQPEPVKANEAEGQKEPPLKSREVKKLAPKAQNTNSSPSFLGSVGRGFANAGRGLAYDAGREVLLNTPGFIIRSAFGF